MSKIEASTIQGATNNDDTNDNARTLPPRYLIRPCTFVYIILMALTLITWLISKSAMSGQIASFTVLGFALFKGFLIGDYYMGLRGISGLWHWVIVLWLVLTGGLITWAFVSAG